jgi:hypothetical protein
LLSQGRITGGSKALVDINNNKVLGSLDKLGRLNASYQWQVAFNRRVLRKEEEVAHIDSELSDFLQ